MRDSVNPFTMIIWAAVLYWIISSMRKKTTSRIDEMRRSEQAEEERLDRVISCYFKPTPLNGLLIDREVSKSSVRLICSCNNCGAPLKDATLCNICAAKKPVSS